MRRPPPDDSWVVASDGLYNPVPISTVAAPCRARVDGAGALTVDGAGWSLDWWVRSADRWHFPSRAAAVRQRLLGGCPVVETAMRVPGGDVVERAFAVPAGKDAPCAVVEVENMTANPVAVAFALRPWPAGIGSIEQRDRVVMVDGIPAVVLQRAPSDVRMSAYADGDVAHALEADRQDAPAPEVHCRERMASAAVVFALAHRARIQVLVPLTPRAPSGRVVVPPVDAVVRGWVAQADRGARFVTPPGLVTDAFTASRRFLLQQPELGDARDLADVAIALDRLGHHAGASELLLAVPAQQRFGGAFPGEGATAEVLAALGAHWRLTRDQRVLVQTLPAAALAARALRRSHAPELGDAADLLRAAGEDRAAKACEGAASGARQPEALPDASGAGPVFTWTGGRVWAQAARFVSAFCDTLVTEHADELIVVPELPEGWAGQEIDVRELPTRFGRFSMSVRWHGEHPALLWEVEPPANDEDSSLRCVRAPGLAVGWSSEAPVGEELLRGAG